MITNILPTDVERYILEYLTMPLDIKSLKKVSKTIKKTVINMPEVIEKNRITDQVFMMNEDSYFFYNKRTLNPLVLSSLADTWNKHYKWCWQNTEKNKIIKNYWTIGEFIDAKDKIDVWGPAYIKDIKIEPTQDDFVETRRLYLVEFLGWTKEFDEWIPGEKIKKLGTKTLNPLKNIGSTEIKENCWILHNNINKGWTVTICTKLKKFNEQCIKISFQQYYNRLNEQNLIINKKDIYKHIKPISTVSTFLCATEKRLDLENRKILM